MNEHTYALLGWTGSGVCACCGLLVDSGLGLVEHSFQSGRRIVARIAKQIYLCCVCLDATRYLRGNPLLVDNRVAAPREGS